jgi:hypothetical protein
MNQSTDHETPLHRLPPPLEIRRHLGSLLRELRQTRQLLKLAEEISEDRVPSPPENDQRQGGKR